MILGSPGQAQNAIGHRATLDDLFRRAAVRHPDKLALADPPNRESFTSGPPRRLTYAQADQVIWALAARLRQLRLPTDSVVAVQLPNTIESALTLLAILRAGLIAAPLPLLWRRKEIVAALGSVSARAFITATQIGDVGHATLATEAASEMFPIRHVCAFGTQCPDGVVALDDIFAPDRPDFLVPTQRSGNPAAHVAAVTFDTTAAGIIPVGRNHIELIAGGLGIFLEGGTTREGTLLSATAMTSYAGLSVTLLPWLLAAGTLVLHQAFEPQVFAAQCESHGVDNIVLPGPVAARLSETSLLDARALQSIIALWRSPERIAPAILRNGYTATVDVSAFGEVGLIAGARTPKGAVARIPLGEIGAPRASANAMPLVETARTIAGTLALRGPMVPIAPFPPGAENGGTLRLWLDDDGFVDTGYPCSISQSTDTITITGPQAGTIEVGGYRIMRHEADSAACALQASAVIAALPDALTGQRLRGTAAEPAFAGALEGLNPLIADAFRPRAAA